MKILKLLLIFISLNLICYSNSFIAKYNDNINYEYIDKIDELNLYLLKDNTKYKNYEYIEKNYEITAQSVNNSNDTHYFEQTYLKKYDLFNLIEKHPVKTAILDSGVDFSHEDIKGSGDIDVNGHGTAIAGIIGAIKNNKKGIYGISNTEMISIRILNKYGKGTYFSLIKGIVKAVSENVKIISIHSGGIYYSKALEEAVNYATENNCIIIASGGNTNSKKVLYPAKFKNVICIGALNNENEKCSEADWGFNKLGYPLGSCYGSNVDIMVKGVNIFSTAMNNKYYYFNGTSFSTAIITGISAYILSNEPKLNKNELIINLKKFLNNNKLYFNDKNNYSNKTSLFKTIITKKNKFNKIKIKKELNIETNKTLKINWKEINSKNKFTQRRNFSSFVFKDKLWIIGGYNGKKYLNDIWNSTNGINWNLVRKNADFPKRSGHYCIVYNNKIWLIGGQTADKMNDIWVSENGINWTLVNNNANFSARAGHSVVIFKNKLWLISGEDNNGVLNDVWYSQDGNYWARVNEHTEFSPRAYHSCIKFNNMLYIIGGTYQNDIWASKNGMNWNKISKNNNIPKISYKNLIVFNNRIFIIGGFNKTQLNETWYSNDLIKWNKINSINNFNKCDLHCCTIFRNKIWILGGFDSQKCLNDIFCNE